jgi:hypothetical protein
MEAQASHGEDDVHANDDATVVIVAAVVVVWRNRTMPRTMSTMMPHAHELFVGHNKSAQFTPRLRGRQDIPQRQIFYRFVRHLLRPLIIPPRKRPPAGGEQRKEDEHHQEGMTVAAATATAAAATAANRLLSFVVCGTAERRVATKQYVCDDAHQPKVEYLIVFTQEHLRSYVIWRPDDGGYGAIHPIVMPLR